MGCCRLLYYLVKRVIFFPWVIETVSVCFFHFCKIMMNLVDFGKINNLRFGEDQCKLEKITLKFIGAFYLQKS